MANLESYNGSVKLISGLSPVSDGYPLMQAGDILVDDDGNRLDTKILTIENRIGMNDAVSGSVSMRVKVLEDNDALNTAKISTAENKIATIEADIGSDTTDGSMKYEIKTLKNAVGNINNTASASGTTAWSRIKNAETDISELQDSLGASNNIADSSGTTAWSRINSIQPSIDNIESFLGTPGDTSASTGNKAWPRLKNAETDIDNLQNNLGTSTTAASASGTTAWSRIKNAEYDIDNLETFNSNLIERINSDENTINDILDSIGDYSDDQNINSNILWPAINGIKYYINDNTYVSVKEFGAVGDGVTDDTIAIQNALNNCTKLIFERGKTYKISHENLDNKYVSSNILHDNSNVILYCDHNIDIDFNGANFIADFGTMFKFGDSNIIKSLNMDTSYTYKNIYDYNINLNNSLSVTDATGMAFVTSYPTERYNMARRYYYKGFASSFNNDFRLIEQYPIDIENPVINIVKPVTVHLKNLGNCKFNLGYKLNSDLNTINYFIPINQVIYLVYNIRSTIDNCNTETCNAYNIINVYRSLYTNIKHSHIMQYGNEGYYTLLNTDGTITIDANADPVADQYLIAMNESSFSNIDKCYLYNEMWHCITTGANYISYSNKILNCNCISTNGVAICDHDNAIYTQCINTTSSGGIMLAAMGYVHNCKIVANKTNRAILRFNSAPDKRNANYFASDVYLYGNTAVLEDDSNPFQTLNMVQLVCTGVRDKIGDAEISNTTYFNSVVLKNITALNYSGSFCIIRTLPTSEAQDLDRSVCEINDVVLENTNLDIYGGLYIANPNYYYYGSGNHIMNYAYYDKTTKSIKFSNTKPTYIIDSSDSSEKVTYPYAGPNHIVTTKKCLMDLVDFSKYKLTIHKTHKKPNGKYPQAFKNQVVADEIILDDVALQNLEVPMDYRYYITYKIDNNTTVKIYQMIDDGCYLPYESNINKLVMNNCTIYGATWPDSGYVSPRQIIGSNNEVSLNVLGILMQTNCFRFQRIASLTNTKIIEDYKYKFIDSITMMPRSFANTRLNVYPGALTDPIFKFNYNKLLINALNTITNEYDNNVEMILSAIQNIYFYRYMKDLDMFVIIYEKLLKRDKSFSVNDYCIHNNNLYKCITAHSITAANDFTSGTATFYSNYWQLQS